MVRILHPRATDAFDRDPASAVAVPTEGTRYLTVGVDDEGYVDVPPEYAEGAMDRLESSFDVEYDREGEAPYDIVGADTGGDSDDDAGDDPDGGGDEPPDDEEVDAETGAETSEGDDADDTDDAVETETDAESGTMMESDAGLETTDESDDEDAAEDEDAGDDEQAGDEDDVESWANWNESDWKAMHYQQREEDVLEGRVDDHLDDVKRVEGSETVVEAVKERADEIDYDLADEGEITE